MSIKVYCDAGSNLYPEILKAKSLDINVLSMDVSLGEKTYHLYHDDVNVKEFSKEFFNTLKSNKDSVRTSLVSPGDFLDAFKKEVEAAPRGAVDRAEVSMPVSVAIRGGNPLHH